MNTDGILSLDLILCKAMLYGSDLFKGLTRIKYKDLGLFYSFIYLTEIR